VSERDLFFGSLIPFLK